MVHSGDKRDRPERVRNRSLHWLAFLETPYHYEEAEISFTAVESLLRAILLHELHPEHVSIGRSHRVATTTSPDQRRRSCQSTDAIINVAGR